MRLRERVFPYWMWRLPAGRGEIALTFDDGPHKASTPQLLDVLGNLDIQVTMFVTGSACAAYPDLMRHCATAGHGIAVHGYIHESCLWHSSEWQRDQILRTTQVLTDQGIPYQRLYRPPFGRFNHLTPRVLNQLDFAGVLWSQMPGDWRDRSPSRLQDDMIRHLHDRNIIVMHDQPGTIANVAACLPALTAEVRRRGWRFICLARPPAPDSTVL